MWWLLAAVGPLAGVALGSALADWHARITLRRAAVHLFMQHPMSTKMPTSLKHPSW